MTKEKVLAVITRYRSILKERYGVEKQKHLPTLAPTEREALAHCYAMLDEMEGFIRENRMDKTFRWLGFIQGTLWVSGVFTLEELKTHNRRDS